MFGRLTLRGLGALLVVAGLGYFLLSPGGLANPARDLLLATSGGCTAPYMNCYSGYDTCVNTGLSDPNPVSYYYDYQGIPWIGASFEEGDLICMWRFNYYWPNTDCSPYEAWQDSNWFGTPC
jgi:hypothetical protein